MLRGLTQLENLASFYHIYHFAIYGHGELLAVRLWPRWGAPRVKGATYQAGMNSPSLTRPDRWVGRERGYI